MVDPDAALQELRQLQHLRQLPVRALQSLHAFVNEVVDVRLLHRGSQVETGEDRRVLVAPVPRQRERHHGQLVLLGEVIDERDPDVLLLLRSDAVSDTLGTVTGLALALALLFRVEGFIVTLLEKSPVGVLSVNIEKSFEMSNRGQRSNDKII